MIQRLSLFNNKVARRFLLSFVLAALLPIGILGLLSFKEVSSQLRGQTAKALHDNSKNYALGLIGQLTLFENTLKLVSHQIEKSGDGFNLITSDREQELVRQFVNLAVIEANGKKSQLINVPGFIPDLTAAEIHQIAAGRVYFKSVAELDQGERRYWLAITIDVSHPDSGILMAELRSELIWRADNLGSNSLWVLDDDGNLLFASQPDLTLSPNLKAQFLANNNGQFSFKDNESDYVGAYWRIPINSLPDSNMLTIVEAQPETLAFEAIRQFSKIYPPVIVLSVLIVVYLSTRLIARYLTPLEHLRAATKSIAGGDFSSRVTIDSNDEFEALGDSFNEMTRRLRSQFDIMSAMAEMDRHILSSLNADDIVETALQRLPNILFCDFISIAQFDANSFQIRDIQNRHIGGESETISGPIMMIGQDVSDLLAMQQDVIEVDGKGKLSTYLHVLGTIGDWRYLIVPVVVNETLSSVICLGYKPPNIIPPESRNAARNFGDRIAVALSNAAWEEKLYRQAHFDTLTGLPNRLVLNDRLRQEVARAKRNATQFAVIFIDLDRFKYVNDSLGHSAGDDLLGQVSKIFVGCVRETDLVVRTGGDEFVIVLTDLYHPYNPMESVRNIAEKILSALNQTLVVAGHAMTFTASLGIAVFPGDANDVQDLLKNADAAMYYAKSEGRGNFQFYSKALNATALENIKLEQELRGAIGKGELRILYQPKVNVARQIVGAEALIRWQHSELGVISPAKFIPLAEQTGLIVEIGEWMLEQTCLWVNACRAQGVGPLRVSVNLSAIEFKRPELVEKIAAILARTGVNPNCIELELTESVAIGNANTCIQRMKELKSLGLTLAMDDFGTGFSSLSYLKSLPLDVLKIDQTFVRQLESEESSQAIVKAILALANGLGMEVVAEGVETEGQLAFLRQQQCGIFQGFLFSHPLSADDFMEFLMDSSLKMSA